ncbi:hypothetical protein [Chimaeribacter arupi]|uniref:hypothetical protein n=1 Tax=Chimaeribacter arupi TaxID=2060066 RepID=UPI00294705E1|nr:hypothetical protein [Chimaeribacter arupi]MDV5140865.1 hypothetical protein [Chimaeribacter arupi]
MKRSFIFLSVLIAGCAVPHLASSRQGLEAAQMMEQAMLTGKSSGICATYEKMFKYAESTGKKEDMDFAESFFTNAANEQGRTPQGFLDFCKDVFASSEKMQRVIDEYK